MSVTEHLAECGDECIEPCGVKPVDAGGGQSSIAAELPAKAVGAARRTYRCPHADDILAILPWHEDGMSAQRLASCHEVRELASHAT